VIGEVFAHAVECYPEECCGLALGPPGSAPERVVRCTNVQNRQLSRGESTLDASRAFWIDERELLDATRDAEAEGKTILLIYHSHVDSAAYFSQQDLRGALGLDGAPLWPDAAQLVVSVRDGVVREAALFEWGDEVRAYRGRRVEEGD
jgi:proteasome lid subunit RPN8/RPN11